MNNVPIKLRLLAMANVHTVPFSVITADPAWLFDDKLPGANRGAGKNYREQHIDNIIERNFEFAWPTLADDCILFLWRVSSQVEEAYRVVRAWGFVPKSEIVWNKRTKNGKKWMGMGRTGRQSHETCIVATRGRSANVVHDKGVRSTFTAKVPTYEANHPKVGQPLLDKHGNERFNKKTGKRLVIKAGDYIHSAKPSEFHDLVERMCHGPYVELFARRTRPGWTTLGNEVWDGR
jgi:N6-adenosine-specific RNA methylase IME4